MEKFRPPQHKKVRFARPANPKGWPLVLAILVLAHSGCQARTSFCDDFQDGSCREVQTAERTYRFTVPKDRSDTWRSLCDYMYFHSRETPGIRHDFAGSLGAQERAALRRTLHCGYELQTRLGRTQGELEGKKIDENGAGLWCFDYLGAMLKDHLKKHGNLESPPSEDLFPLRMTLWFQSAPGVPRNELGARVSLKWTVR